MKSYFQLHKIILSKIHLKLVFAFLIVSFYVIDFSFGVYLTPDSFTYLSGAKNLLNEQGFIYDCNYQPIIVFPKFYSYFLIPFLKFGNLSSNSIIFSLILLYFISLFQLTKYLKINFNTWSGLFLFFLICHILFTYHNSVLSESLFIPLFISWFICIESDNDNYKKLFVIFALEILLVSTRYSAIVLICSYYFVDFFYSLMILKKGLNATIFKIKYLVPVFSTLYYWVLQVSLKEESFIHLKNIYNDLDVGYSINDYLVQVISDIGDTVFGKMISFQLQAYMLLIPITILMLLFLYKIFQFQFKFKTIIYLFFILIFHITILYNGAAGDPLRGRLMFWVYIILICSVRLTYSEFNYKKYLLFSFSLFIILFANDIYFLTKKIQYSFEGAYKGILYNNTYYGNKSFTSSFEKQPEYVRVSGKTILVPPCFKWNL